MSDGLLSPDWPVDPRVAAVTTLRTGPRSPGASRGPWADFNLGDRVGDEPDAVRCNRNQLREVLDLPADPAWLKQVHGTRVVTLPTDEPSPEGDAAVCERPGSVCAILTADCLPVFLARRDGMAVGLAHAGWRGLAAGVIEATLDCLPGEPADMAAWLGPAIGATAFQVGDEVREAFVSTDPGAIDAFRPDSEGRWCADLHALARRRLEGRGVDWVGGTQACTWSEPARFFSHRRQAPCGRMASLIWIRPST